MLVIRQKMIYRSDLRSNPDVLYVFGDNLERRGMGGQAKEMRGELNAFGVATKIRASHNFPHDFIFDGDLDSMRTVEDDLLNLEDALTQVINEDYNHSPKWKAVVIPADGIGTGLARLSENAPNLLKHINKQFELLKGI